jgi:hypothetical protein
MANPYRKSPRELINLYHLEPRLRDVFVEGTSDQSLLRWFFGQTGLQDVKIYPANTVQIANTFPVENGGGGEKGRVLSLALELAKALPADAKNAICIVDRDLIGVCQPPLVCRLLLTTEYSCIESYALNNVPLTKFFNMYFEHAISPVLLDSIYETLAALFFLRAAKFELHFTSSWVDHFTDSVALAEDLIEFDQERFAKKIANKSNGAFTEQELIEKAKEIEQRTNLPILSKIHKRDALQLLCWIGRHVGCDHVLCRPEAAARALFLSLDIGFVETFDLFRFLKAWAA